MSSRCHLVVVVEITTPSLCQEWIQPQSWLLKLNQNKVNIDAPPSCWPHCCCLRPRRFHPHHFTPCFFVLVVLVVIVKIRGLNLSPPLQPPHSSHLLFSHHLPPTCTLLNKLPPRVPFAKPPIHTLHHRESLFGWLLCVQLADAHDHHAF